MQQVRQWRWKIFKEEKSIEILKIYNHFQNIAKEKITHEFRLKEIDETKNSFIKEIKQNELLSKKHKNVCTIINYTEHLLISASMITRCVSFSAFASLVGIPAGFASFTVGIKICSIFNWKV